MSWMARLRNLARSNRHSRDLDREFDFHIRERADDLIARGMEPAAALVEARRRFGNRAAQKERARDFDLFPLLDSIRGDVRYAIRALAASPVFTVVAVASLALGIGANTAIYSLIDAIVLRSLPVVRPHELVRVTLGTDEPALTTATWEQLRERQHVFSGMFSVGNLRSDLATTGVVRPVRGSFVGGDFFGTLGVKPATGRLLSAADDYPGCPGVAVLGHAFWQGEYGGDTAIVGKALHLAGHPFQVVGVVDKRFSGIEVGEAQSVYAPACAAEILRPGTMEHRTWYVIGRLRPDVSPEQARASLAAMSRPVLESALSPQITGKRREERLARRFTIEPAGTGVSFLRVEFGKPLYLLAGIVAIVLLVACANVANLLLARGTTRQREVAVRLALGASRSRLTRQLLIESLVLALAGAGLGIGVAYWGGKVLVSLMAQGSPVFLDLAPNWRLLGFATAVGVLTALVFGVMPALRETAVDPQDALKTGARGIAGRRHGLWLGKALVASQLALALVVVTSAALLLGSFVRLARLDPGFQVERILLVTATLPDDVIPETEQPAIQSRFLSALERLPSVESATSMALTPIAGVYMGIGVVVRGPSGEMVEANPQLNDVGARYFSTMGIPLVAGRDFSAEDREGMPPVAIVNRAAAAKFFPGVSPIGRTLQTKDGKGKLSAPLMVVGVVGDAKYWSLRAKSASTIYRPIAQVGAATTTYALRTTADPSALTASVTASAAALEPRLRLAIRPLSSQVAESLTREQVLAVLSTCFGALALLLATLGVYGIVSYGVSRRRNEFGIRIAVGATPRQVISLVGREVAILIGIGLVTGTAVAFASTRLIRSFLYDLTPTDPRVFGGSILLLVVIACGASVIPALRASRVDPVFALREE